jgi:outer membrane biosynthesis protein TonB
MKRERLTEGETLMNVDDLLPFVENMLTERKNAVEKLNAKYGLNVTVDLKSAWKTEKENNDKNTENVDTETPEEMPDTETEKIVETIRKMREEETNETEETPETEETNETEETTETEETKETENETEKEQDNE